MTARYSKPVNARISSPFGPRDTGMHNGIDYAAPYGTPIRAPHAGVVSFVGTTGNAGNNVAVDVTNGPQTFRYRVCHMNARPAVRKGARVKQGQILGYVGQSGNARGPHLHFEIYVITPKLKYFNPDRMFIYGNKPTIRQGSTGNDVREWQRVVGAKQDGVFGPATTVQTKKYQTAKRLKADGIVGPNTWFTRICP